MDNKKLMHILLRDVHELEQLIVEIGHNGHVDKLDLELLNTRIKGVRHLLEVASEMDTEPALVRETTIQPPVTAIPVSENPRPPELSTVPAQAPLPITPVPVQPDEPPLSEPEGAATETPQADPKTTPENTAAGELIFREEEESHPDKQVLGEKFTAGKSVHDMLLLEKGKSDLRFSLPIANLTSAIGTNDRFLFTRELFDGNMDRFYETIRKLDAMTTIREAVDFLQENFQWKKNETSNKFLELVKRRFS